MRREPATGAGMEARTEILRRIKEREAELLTLVSELVRRPSENPPGDTRAVLDFVVEYLRARGFAPEVVASQPTMPNVVVSVEGRAPGRHMILNGHLDTFPIGDRSLWELDPFSGLVADGRIHGRGVSDMKAGVGASITTFCLLGEMRDAWRGRATLALVSDEETFGPWGANYLVDHYPKLRGDAALIGEPSSPKTVRFGERGLVWVRLTARGQSAHSAYPHQGWNAIAAMVEILQELKALEGGDWQVPEDFLRTIDGARQVTDELLGAGATDLLSAVIVNSGTIRGGTKVNLIADFCEAEVDVRIPPGVSTAEILREIGQVVRKHRGVSYELLARSEPNYSPPDHELFSIVTRNVAEVRGETPLLNISSPGTDARVFRRVGIPVAVYGPRPYHMGAANEYVTVEDYLDTVRVHSLSAVDFLSVR